MLDVRPWWSGRADQVGPDSPALDTEGAGRHSQLGLEIRSRIEQRHRTRIRCVWSQSPKASAPMQWPRPRCWTHRHRGELCGRNALEGRGPRSGTIGERVPAPIWHFLEAVQRNKVAQLAGYGGGGREWTASKKGGPCRLSPGGDRAGPGRCRRATRTRWLPTLRGDTLVHALCDQGLDVAGSYGGGPSR